MTPRLHPTRPVPLLAVTLAVLLLAAATPRTLAAQVIREANAPPTQLVQELFLAEMVQAQKRGEVQLSAKGRTDRAGDGWIRRGQGLVEVGVTDRVQLSLVTPEVGTDLDPESRRYEPGVLVAIVPQAMPMAISAFGSVAFCCDAPTATTVGVVVARTWYALQIHGANRWHLDDGRQTASLAALYDKGRLTPTLEVAIDDDQTGNHWSVAPGLFVHPGRSLELGAGALLSPSRGPVFAGARLVVTASF